MILGIGIDQEEIGRIEKAIKNKDSKIEQLLRKELWARGLRYHKNSKCECFYKDIYRPE